jgi:putative glutamine amidotransferase
MRIALTLDRNPGKREENDYIQSLLDAGFSREEIDLVEPGQMPPESFDGIVLGGGCDVDPRRYGQSPRAGARLELDSDRDETDLALFDKAWREGVPVLGICRGLQVINVALGGTLVQDIPTERPSEVIHQRSPRQKMRLDHEVEISPGTRLAEIAGASRFAVNSRHHQAILKAAPGVKVSATAPDGLIEAVEYEAGDRWLLAVQWHPENLAGDRVSRALFGEFARSVRRRLARGISGRQRALTRA